MDKITVKYGVLKKVVEALDSDKITDDTEISFEYVVGSCFPNVMRNIKQALYHQYTNGYIDGLKDKKPKQEKKLS